MGLVFSLPPGLSVLSVDRSGFLPASQTVCLVHGWAWSSACLPDCLSVLSVGGSGFLFASQTVCLVHEWVWFSAYLADCLYCLWAWVGLVFCLLPRLSVLSMSGSDLLPISLTDCLSAGIFCLFLLSFFLTLI